MTETWIVLLVKPPHESKLRLAPVLDAAARAQLAERLLLQQLETLAPFAGRARLAVISRAARPLGLAAARGAWALGETPPHTLNGAAAQALATARHAGASTLLLLPVDLPWMSTDDVEALLAGPDTEIALAGDRHGSGTNALRLPAALPFRFGYGDESHFYHQEEARRLGVPCRLLARPGLQFDLDTVDDWAIYRRWRMAADGPPRRVVG